MRNGMAPIGGSGAENPIHQILFRVALSTGNRYFWQLSANIPSMRHTVGRFRGAFDLPDLPGEGNDVRGGPDELERGR